MLCTNDVLDINRQENAILLYLYITLVRWIAKLIPNQEDVKGERLSG